MAPAPVSCEPLADAACPASPKVEFCGYSNPHPSEPKIHLRIQMYGECPLPRNRFESQPREDDT